MKKTQITYATYVYIAWLFSYIRPYMYIVAHIYLETQNCIGFWLANVRENVMSRNY